MKHELPPNNLLSVEVPIKPIRKQTILIGFGPTKLDLGDRKIHRVIFIPHICTGYFARCQRVVDTDESIISNKHTAPGRGSVAKLRYPGDRPLRLHPALATCSAIVMKEKLFNGFVK